MQEKHSMEEVAAELERFKIEISSVGNSYNHLLEAISEKINHLITHNFSLLISLLYRLDISEKKLKELLSKSHGISSGNIIAKMIIERQLQKIESRKAFKNKSFSDEERW